jgi:hypothetical protein
MPIKQKPLNSKFISFSLSDFISKNTIKKKKTNKKQSHEKSHTKINTKSVTNTKSKTKYDSKLALIIQSNKNNISNVLNTIYSMNNTINSSLIKYNDKETNLLIKESYNNFKISKPFSSDILNSYYDSINELHELKKEIRNKGKNTHKMPYPITNATEDFTRGLSKFISNRYNQLPAPTISNAFTKLWEVLETFPQIINKNSKSFKVFHICEAPGQMILATKYFVSKKRPNIDMKDTKYTNSYDWKANSLNPYNAENKSKYIGKTFADDYNLIKNNPKKWLWGADNTGDITKVKNIKWFRKYINDQWLSSSNKDGKIDFICGDGGLSTDNDPFLLQKLDLAQAITVVACSSKGGSCCIKHFTPFIRSHKDTYNASGFFLGFLYLYYISFEQVSLFKPYSSNFDSGEFYVVGVNFLGISESQIENLYKVLDGFKLNHAIIEKEKMPETFIIQINNFIKNMSELNNNAIEKTNLLLTCYDNMPNTKGGKGAKSGKGGKNGRGDSEVYELLKCNNFLDDKNIETILIPRYNEWIKKYEFE